MNRLPITLISIASNLLLLPTAPALPHSDGYSHPLIVAQALSVAQIRQLAQDITVKVSAGNQHGSGVLIAQVGHTYTVVTNAHVITETGLRIQTADGKIYPAILKQRGSSLEGNDLAVLEFQSQQSYRVVPLTPTSNLSVNQPVYAAGFADDSPQLVFNAGQISLLTPKPLVGGYQIGYTNEIKQGMSGGPVLNGQGKLIGINGLLASAILNDAYVYQDGSQPTSQLRQRLQQTSFAVPAQTLANFPVPAQALAQVLQPQLAAIPGWNQAEPTLSQPASPGLLGRIERIAGEITLRIDSKRNGNGSGVTIAHQGQTYYVLTAFHVVRNSDEYTVVTPDGEKHPVLDKDIVKENGLDVAILKFTSSRQYQVATLAKSNLSNHISIKQIFQNIPWIFFSGFPGADAGKRKLTSGLLLVGEIFFLDQIKDTATELSNGYQLVYSNISLRGMSGGPLLDTQGRVIGIGGRQEGEPYSQKINRDLGYALGVPISTGLGLATRNGIKPEWMKIETTSLPASSFYEWASIRNQLLSTVQKPAPNADENEWLNYGNQLWRLIRFDEAVEALRQAIKLNPDFYQAYYLLGLVQESQDKYQAAVATFKQVTQINPNYYQAWREESKSLYSLKQYPEALEAINQSIRLNTEQADTDSRKDFILYLKKAQFLEELKRYSEAEAAYTEAIKIKPSYIAYYERGVFRTTKSENYQGAEADFTKAIALNPEFSLAYVLRGFLRTGLENFQGAEEDFTKAIALDPEEADFLSIRKFLRVIQSKNYQELPQILPKRSPVIPNK